MIRFEFCSVRQINSPFLIRPRVGKCGVSPGKGLLFESESSNKRTYIRLPFDNGVMCYPAQGLAFAGLRLTRQMPTDMSHRTHAQARTTYRAGV
jgi:hypothetical protein